MDIEYLANWFSQQTIHPVLWLIPFISAGIGWATNAVAIKMLFRPRNPLKFPGFTLQGLIPKRHAEIAGAVSKAVEKDFLTTDDLHKLVHAARLDELLKVEIGRKWDEKAKDLLSANPMIQMFIPTEKIDEMKERVLNSFVGDIDSMVDRIAGQVSEKADIAGMIMENILAFDYDRLESIINEIAKNEFRYIERLGGVLGFVIGMVQVGLVWFTS